MVSFSFLKYFFGFLGKMNFGDKGRSKEIVRRPQQWFL